MVEAVRESAGSRILSSIVRCVIASSILVPLVASSSSVSRNNYNVYNYDQTTPQFTPDGRLLQVEYASSAADVSAPMVVLEFISSKSSTTSGDDDESSLAYPCTVLITLPKQPFSPQNRIVIIEKSNLSKKPSSFLQRSTYCVAMSGILADSLALLQAGIKKAAEHSLQYQEVLDMESFVQVLADECQSRVFAGGLRPYGSTLLLCGYEDDKPMAEGDKVTASSNRDSFQSLIYQTDPSGGILQHSGRSGGEDNNERSKTLAFKKKQPNVRTEVRCIVGGSPSLQRQLRKQIHQGMVRFEQKHRNSLSLADRIASVAKILIKETVDTNSNDGTADRASISRTKSRNSNENSLSSSNHPLEVVIVSPRLGCHRLEGKQLQAIQKLVNTDK